MQQRERSLRRAWWRRPVVRGIAAALVAAPVIAAVAFRGHRPAVLDGVRRFNRNILNPAMLHLAGRRHWYAARLEHVGRRSGLARATPVVARPLRAGFAVPLPYGTDVDWLRNIQASGRATLVVGGTRYAVEQPRVLPTAAIADELGPFYRRMSRVSAIRSWLLLAVEPGNGAVVPTLRAVTASR
ncbi:hypothetical protein [Pseudonocardia sp.]|uniref:hypothetical protein n=1 Tax=Pseudonocardia sp. TaxID=60912 RepID=UPI003D130D06